LGGFGEGDITAFGILRASLGVHNFFLHQLNCINYMPKFENHTIPPKT